MFQTLCEAFCIQLYEVDDFFISILSIKKQA